MSIKKNTIWEIIPVIILIAWFILGIVFCVHNYRDILTLIGYISIIVGIPASLLTLLQYFRGRGQNNEVNKTISHNTWRNHNFKWIAIVSVLVSISILLFYKLHENKTQKVEKAKMEKCQQDSIQRRFNDLDKKFDNRMKQELTFENAYELIRGDSCVLYEILGMINDNPEIEAKQEKYTERFRNRVKVAKKTIIDAIVDYPGNDGEKMCEEYGPKINQIEQMLNSL